MVEISAFASGADVWKAVLLLWLQECSSFILGFVGALAVSAIAESVVFQDHKLIRKIKIDQQSTLVSSYF